MKYIKMLILLSLIILFSACDKRDKDNQNALDKLTSSELSQLGWESFRDNNFIDADMYFSALLLRNEDFLIGYYGLGWTYLKTYKYLNAKTQFNNFFVKDTLGIYSQNDSIFKDVKAGQIICLSALSQYQQVITNSNLIPPDWTFTHDALINYIDIVLIKASAQYSLALFQDSLTTLRIIVPDFNPDVSTIEGRILLHNKIEELMRIN